MKSLDDMALPLSLALVTPVFAAVRYEKFGDVPPIWYWIVWALATYVVVAQVRLRWKAKKEKRDG